MISAINHLESEFKPLFVYARRSIEDAVIEALRPNEAGERRTLLRELRLDFQHIHQGSYSVSFNIICIFAILCNLHLECNILGQF